MRRQSSRSWRGARATTFGATLLVLATSAFASLSCGGSGDGASSGGGAGGGAWGGAQTPGDWVEMPPDIEPKVRALVDEITRLACERSRNCCPGFDLKPRQDCASYATALIVAGAHGHIGPADAKTFDFHYNEALAQVCLDKMREQVNSCVFRDELTTSTTWQACTGVLLVNPKGQNPLECLFDPQCAIGVAPGARCIDHRCLPEVEVPLGESCFVEASATAVPGCGPLGTCNYATEKCTARGRPGEACGSSNDDACVDGYGCSDGKCAPRLADGQPCDTSKACQLGADCRRIAVESTDEVCVSYRAPGEACDFAAQCENATCDNGICKPNAMAICEIPPPVH